MSAAASSTSNPIKITGGAISTSTKITDNDVVIKKIVWFGATTNAHLIQMQDKNGNTIWKATMTTANLGNNIETIFPGIGFSCHGVYCDKMDSGEVYIYI